MKNKIIIFIAGIIIIFGLAIVYKPKSQPVSQPTTTEAVNESLSVTQTINGEKKTVSEEKGTTALQLLQNTETVEMKGEGENAFVTEIDGVVAQDTKKQYWAFYINGKPSEVGAGSYILKEGDEIEWKLATY